MEIQLRRKTTKATTEEEEDKGQHQKNLHFDDFDLADSDREDYHNNVDILFVLDTTGSMGSYFQPAIDTIKKIVQKFSKMEFNIKFSLCAYRDHPPQESTYITEFTDLTNSKNLVNVLSKLTASGGGDGPEAVMDGLREGLKNSSWRVSEDGETISKRFLFHICDAPPHGKEYGQTSSDPSWTQSGCPCGTKKEDINKLLKEHKVDYHLIKAVSSVNLMEKVFKNCFESNFAETIELDSPSTQQDFYEDEGLEEAEEVGEAKKYEAEEYEKEEILQCEDADLFDERTVKVSKCVESDLEKAEIKKEKKVIKTKKVEAPSRKKQMWEGVISALDKKLG